MLSLPFTILVIVVTVVPSVGGTVLYSQCYQTYWNDSSCWLPNQIPKIGDTTISGAYNNVKIVTLAVASLVRINIDTSVSIYAGGQLTVPVVEFSGGDMFLSANSKAVVLDSVFSIAYIGGISVGGVLCLGSSSHQSEISLNNTRIYVGSGGVLSVNAKRISSVYTNIYIRSGAALNLSYPLAVLENVKVDNGALLSINLKSIMPPINQAIPFCGNCAISTRNVNLIGSTGLVASISLNRGVNYVTFNRRRF